MSDRRGFAMARAVGQGCGRLRDEPLHDRVRVRRINAPGQFLLLQEIVGVTLLKSRESSTAGALFDEYEPACRPVRADGEDGQRRFRLHHPERLAHGELPREKLQAQRVRRLIKPPAGRPRRRRRNIDFGLAQGAVGLRLVEQDADSASQTLQNSKIDLGRSGHRR